MEWRPAAAMLAVDVALAVMNVMVKKALSEGMNKLVFITLRHAVATLFISPIAFFYERKIRPKLTLEICVYLFFSAMFGASLTQYLFFLGLEQTSATFACAFLNIAPVCTFLISLATRMEFVDLKTKEGRAKAVGTLVCFLGVLVLTLYKGVALNSSSAAVGGSSRTGGAEYGSRKWLTGSIAVIAGCVSWSAWFPLQARLGRKYPALCSCTALVFLLSFLQAASLSLATQRGASVWILRKKMEIATVIFSGAVGSGFGIVAMSWCIEQRGPVFTAAFTPLIQILVAVIDFAFLHEQVYIGSVLGSVLVIAGLYSLLWGKNKEAGKGSVVAKEEESRVNGDDDQVQTPNV
ncbi:WAT1-related protein At3g30340-like isoform X1 [Curcuma longa]|uniref:WAT1-related protein At3g30340-like isoform X1 n=1 Tax=Curcuma longa TaxID=136217 RepID=UPI003D9DE1AA